jgi:predicted aspartyl protease
MGRLTGRLTPRSAFIEVEVLPDPQRMTALVESGATVTGIVAPVALLDTGAEVSVVDSRIIRKLGLGATGACGVKLASPGMVTADTFDLTIVAGMQRRRPARFTVEALGIDLSGHEIDLILGWDVLACCVLTCDGPQGKFSLRF